MNWRSADNTWELLDFLAGWTSTMIRAGKSYWGGRANTVDLLVLTSLDELIFILKIIFSFFTKQATLMRRSTVQSLLPQLIFIPWLEISTLAAHFLAFCTKFCLKWLWLEQLTKPDSLGKMCCLFLSAWVCDMFCSNLHCKSLYKSNCYIIT
jgi:hypothetical protein